MFQNHGKTTFYVTTAQNNVVRGPEKYNHLCQSTLEQLEHDVRGSAVRLHCTFTSRRGGLEDPRLESCNIQIDRLVPASH